MIEGELFAVGSFNTLRLCDKTGVSITLLWSYMVLRSQGYSSCIEKYLGHCISSKIYIYMSY